MYMVCVCPQKMKNQINKSYSFTFAITIMDKHGLTNKVDFEHQPKGTEVEQHKLFISQEVTW